MDYRNWQTSLGRRFRSLKVFFVLRSFGTSGFEEHLRRLITLAAHFESLLLTSPDSFELFVPRRLSLVVFRLRAPSEAAADKLNRAFFALTAERKDTHLKATVVGGKYCTRVAMGSPFTKVERVEAAWKLIRELAAEARSAVV